MSQRTTHLGDISGMAATSVENVGDWLSGAVIVLDDAFGEGYAKANPVAVAGLAVASAISYHADRGLDAAEIIAKAITAPQQGEATC